MQSSTTSDGTFTCRDTLYSHENCRDFQIEIILFGDQHFLIRMKFGICFRRTLHSFQTLCCVCFEYTAFVSNTLLHSFLTHYCVPLQGSYGSWKTWKVLENQNFKIQAWKTWKNEYRSWKVLENCLFLVQ